MEPIIAPSILASDFSRLGEEVRAIEGAADWVHVDVMDNHFVPNLTIGLPVVTSLRKATTIPFDVHLMITDPQRWAPAYAEAGAYNVTFHAEACDDPVALAKTLRAAGAKAGLAIDRDTPVEPYQGAATGVGGIVRDIMAMGARPVAVADPLRFGPADAPDTRRVAPGGGP